jgi:hypothetical protein
MKSARTKVTAGHLGIFLVAVPLLLAVGPKGCPIDVQCGDVLDLDGGQYRLNGDLVCPFNLSGAAVTITGERVHFNLKGYTITRDDGSGRLLEQGILVRGANAHINNGSIVDINCPFYGNQDCSAIRLRGEESAGAWISGMSLHNNTVGILAGGLTNANGARIHGNDITGNLRLGIGLFGTAEGAKITGNDLSDTGGFAAPISTGLGYLGNSDDVSLIGNIANNNAVAGIALFGYPDFPPAQRNTVRDNTTLDNGISGISAGAFIEFETFRARDNLIQSNTSFGNGTWDLLEGTPVGGPFADCLNTWEDNDFDVAEPDCIE